jgi:beta-ketodecanoyl-[acyl-carrier-protein] synthase
MMTGESASGRRVQRLELAISYLLRAGVICSLAVVLVGIAASAVRRFWLHQANLAMNQLVSRRLLGRDATFDEAPVILDEFANTASAGSIIAFHRHRADLKAGDTGIICSFGAGYSIGSVVVRRT